VRVDQDTSAKVFPINNNHQYPRQTVDALVFMAGVPQRHQGRIKHRRSLSNSGACRKRR